MRPAAKLAAFAVVLALAFGAGAAVGDAVGPIDVGGGAAEGVDPGAGTHEAGPHG